MPPKSARAEARKGEFYHPSEEEQAAIEKGPARAKRGEAVEV